MVGCDIEVRPVLKRADTEGALGPSCSLSIPSGPTSCQVGDTILQSSSHLCSHYLPLGKVKLREMMAHSMFLTSQFHPFPVPFFSFYFYWEKTETMRMNFLILWHGYTKSVWFDTGTKTMHFVNTIRMGDYLLELLLAAAISSTFVLFFSRIQEIDHWNKEKRAVFAGAQFWWIINV